jgi:hypothetical protein
MIAKQQEQIKGLNTGLQKVSAQLEVSKPAPQVVNNRWSRPPRPKKSSGISQSAVTSPRGGLLFPALTAF